MKKKYNTIVSKRPALSRSVSLRNRGAAVSSATTIVEDKGWLTREEFLELFQKKLIKTAAGEEKPYIEAKYTLYSLGNLGAFGETEGFNDDEGGGGGISAGVNYERLDRWVDYSPSKAEWVLSAYLGADLSGRLSVVESQYLSKIAAQGLYQPLGSYLTQTDLANYITRTEVEQGYLPATGYESVLDGRYYTFEEVNIMMNNLYSSLALVNQAFEERLSTVEGSYLTGTDLTSYATESWVESQNFISSTEVDNKLKKYIKSSGGVMTGSLRFEQAGAEYGFYIEALADGSMRVNATQNGQYLKGLFTFEAPKQQFALNKMYIGESMSIDPAAKIYGSLAIADTERIYLNHSRTVWVRYNPSLNVIEASHAIVAHGDVEAMVD